MSLLTKTSEVCTLFFKLGLTAFGGPAAHIAMMEDEVVEKRKWMTREHFLDLVGATQLIPGPNSTEMALHCGMHRAGILGLIVSGVAFILPAFGLTLGLAWLYQKSGSIPAFEPLLYGIKPAMIIVIALALHKLSKKAVNSSLKLGIAALVLLALYLGVSEIIALVGGGVLGILSTFLAAPKKKLFSTSLGLLFFQCLKIGSILYGSGYVLIAYVDDIFVRELGWLTPQLLLDAIAIGQLTPGPVLTTATVIGYFIAGFKGAIVATLGIFLPSFIFVLLLFPLIPKLRKSALMSGFLDGVNASAIALMAFVTVSLSTTILSTWEAIFIAAGAYLFSTLNPFKSGAIGLVIFSALLGWVL